MELHCQRCGEPLSSDAAFCPHCAAPQLRWVEPEPAPGDGSATQGPPGWSAAPGPLRWDAAIRSAAGISLITGLLCALFTIGMPLWIGGGVFFTLLLYRRSNPVTPRLVLDTRTAWRLGLLCGFFTSAVCSAATAAALLINRYALHQGARLDQLYQSNMQAASARSTDPAQAAALLKLMDTPEARAALMLAGAAFVCAVILFLSGAAGILAARLSAPRQTS